MTPAEPSRLRSCVEHKYSSKRANWRWPPRYWPVRQTRLEGASARASGLSERYASEVSAWLAGLRQTELFVAAAKLGARMQDSRRSFCTRLGMCPGIGHVNSLPAVTKCHWPCVRWITLTPFASWRAQ